MSDSQAGNANGIVQRVLSTGAELAANAVQQAGFVKTLIGTGALPLMGPATMAKAVSVYRSWGMTAATSSALGNLLHPDATAIVDERRSLTFGDVHGRTNAIAAGLRERGVGEGDGVAIMCRNHAGFLEAMVAAAKVGADALFLNTDFSGPQLREVVEREGATVVIHDEEFAGVVDGADATTLTAWVDDDSSPSDLDELAESGDAADLEPPSKPGRTIILTSGTTGTPKGAQRKPPPTSAAAAFLSKIPFKARETTVIAAPLFHAWGFAHLSIGQALASTVIVRRKFDPKATLQLIDEHDATALVVVPVMLQRILGVPADERKRHDTSSLRVIAVSGSALPGELSTKVMDAFGDVLYNLYGSTEVAWATIATPEDMRAAPGTAGRPPAGTQLKLVDDDGKEVPVGTTGRIFVGSDLLFEGYTGGETKAMLEGFMSTGDVGRLDEDGRLFVEGRDDEMIVSGGENVFPREVEDLLANHEKVADVAVIGVDDETFGQRLKAFVVAADGGVSEDELKSYVRDNLARYKVPREIELLDELPRNPSGKILKRKLKERSG